MGRHVERGQSAVEFAMLAPLLLLIMLGTVDFSRAFYQNIEVSGAERAGLRIGLTTDTTDIGDAIRNEPQLPNTVATWGPFFAGGTQADCTSAVAQQACGSSTGCSAADFSTGNLACFSIQECLLSGSDWGTCTPTNAAAWNSRPTLQTGQTACTQRGLRVKVAYKFAPATSVVARFAPGGAFLLTSNAVGDVLYC